MDWDDGAPFLAKGDAVGDYVLDEEIGRGGMGVVWRARRRAGGTVAIKFLLRLDRTDEPEAVPREFRVAAELTHPHVMPVLDFGFHQVAGGRSLPYIVMLWLEDAAPLDRYVADKGLDPVQRLRLFLALVSALAHAHDRGVVHLDVKPDNILVDRHGHLRLTDFGIARLVMDAPRANAVGTPHYRAPEQRGEREVGLLDQRTDVWALGVVLHELLTGQRPAAAITAPAGRLAGLDPELRAFFGEPAVDHDAETRGRDDDERNAGPPASPRKSAQTGTGGPPPPRPLAETAPPLATAIPHLLPGLDALIAECLKPDRDARPPNAHTVLASCRDVVDATGVATILGRLVGGRPRAIATAATSVAVLVSVVVAVVLSWAVLSFWPAPATTLRSLVPTASAASETGNAEVDVAALVPGTPWPAVHMLEFNEATIRRLREVVPAAASASPDPGERRSLRPLHAAAITELAGRPEAERPRVIVMDIFFIDEDPDADPLLAEAIRFAESQGVTVILPAETCPPAPGAVPDISPPLLETGAPWGMTFSGESFSEQSGRLMMQVDLAIFRDGEFLAASVALQAAVAQQVGDVPVRYRRHGSRILVERAREGWADGQPLMEIPLTSTRNAPQRDDLQELGIHPGDEVLFLELPVPDAASLSASQSPYDEAFEGAAQGDTAPLGGRTVYIIDEERDPFRPPPLGKAGRGLAWATQAIIDSAVVRLATWWNVPLVIAGAGCGVFVGWFVGRRHERRTASVRPAGGHRRWPSPVLGVLSVIGGVLLAAVLVMTATAFAFDQALVVLHPLPALVAAGLGALLIIHGPRATDVIGRLGPRPHVARTGSRPVLGPSIGSTP